MPTKANYKRASRRIPKKKTKRSVKVSQRKQAKRSRRKTKRTRKQARQSKMTGGWQWPWSNKSSDSCTNAQQAFEDVYQKYLQWEGFIAAKHPMVFIRSGPQRGQIAPNPYTTACLQQWQELKNAREQSGCSLPELEARISSGWNPVTNQVWSETPKNPKANNQHMQWPLRAPADARGMLMERALSPLGQQANLSNRDANLARPRPGLLPPLQQRPLPPVKRLQQLEQRTLPLMQQRIRLLRPLQVQQEQVLQQQERVQQVLEQQRLQQQRLQQLKFNRPPAAGNIQNQFVNYRPTSAYLSQDQLQPEALNTPRYWKRQ